MQDNKRTYQVAFACLSRAGSAPGSASASGEGGAVVAPVSDSEYRGSRKQQVPGPHLGMPTISDFVNLQSQSESTTFLDGFDLGRLLCTHREFAYRPSEFDPSLTLLQELAGTYDALVDYMAAIHIREMRCAWTGSKHVCRCTSFEG